MESRQEIMDDLLIRYIQGIATEDEIQVAKEWILSGKQNRIYFDELKDVFEATELMKTTGRFDPVKSWAKVKRRYYGNKDKEVTNDFFKKSIKRFYIPMLRFAAIFIVAFLLGAVLFYKFNMNSTSSTTLVYNEVIVPLGSKTQLLLADGTKVWLNAGSKLRYPVTFAKDSRDVYLEGEGYFEVTKSKIRKFVVHTSYLNIRVLGTEFNVKAYPDEKIIETTLVKGSVIIDNAENSKVKMAPVHLEPNQMARFQTSNTVFAVTTASVPIDRQTLKNASDRVEVIPKIDPIVYTSWKDSLWFIQGETLESLAIKLERRYDVEIEFADLELKRYKFSGTLANETLEQVFNVIKIIAPIDYRIENKKVYLTINNSFKDKYDKMLINQ